MGYFPIMVLPQLEDSSVIGGKTRLICQVRYKSQRREPTCAFKPK